MITGGAYQGKRKYAEKNYKLSETDMINGKNCELSELLTAKCVYNFQFLVKRFEDIAEYLKNILMINNPDIIIITDEIGAGIIPADKSERLWRERVGKVCCLLAEKSDEVIRVNCGIGIKIKGE